MSTFMLRSLTHLDLIFVPSDRYVPICALQYANNPVIPSLFIEDGFFFLFIILASLSLSDVHRFVDL